MRLLLDTHALIWLIVDDGRLGRGARQAILDPANDVFVSIVTFWEMAVTIRAGILTPADVESLIGEVTSRGLTLLSLQPSHIGALQRLPVHSDHRDPFDHQLIAQAIAEDLVLVTDDTSAARYQVQRMPCS